MTIAGAGLVLTWIGGDGAAVRFRMASCEKYEYLQREGRERLQSLLASRLLN